MHDRVEGRAGQGRGIARQGQGHQGQQGQGRATGVVRTEQGRVENG